MAINVLKGLRTRVASPSSEPLEAPLGQPPGGPRIACSNCGRPLGLTQVACPGCGAHVVAGVPLKRGAGLLLAGSLGGLLVGSALAVVVALAGHAGTSADSQPVASNAPGGVVDPSADPGLISGPVSPTAAAALKLTVEIEDRLAAAGAQLKAESKAKSFNAVKAATTIREVAADAALGSDQVDRLAGWQAASPLRAQLTQFYQSVRQNARDALAVSLDNSAKYKQAAKRIARLLGSIQATRLSIEALAAANRISIPAKPAP
ncbi:MAG: hypothetical protein QOF11_939 [Chloroflexota bacterium]|jgi:hypothetical protein|nr:hypothetical protein [Chloroflexota bacterium]